MEWQGFNSKVFLHVFDHTILPILNYGAEVWGNSPWNELENLHLQACKYTLGVHQSTPTDGVYSELGRYPLYVYQKISIIKYLKRLEGLSNEHLVKKAFNQLNKITIIIITTGYHRHSLAWKNIMYWLLTVI